MPHYDHGLLRWGLKVMMYRPFAKLHLNHGVAYGFTCVQSAMGSVLGLEKGHIWGGVWVHAGGWFSDTENRLKNTKCQSIQPPQEARNRSDFFSWLINKGISEGTPEPKPN